MKKILTSILVLVVVAVFANVAVAKERVVQLNIPGCAS